VPPLPTLPPPREVTAALLAGDGAQVLEAAQAYLGAGGPAFVADALAQPVLEQVGERWSQGGASIAEEHAATALLREVLLILMPGLSWQRGGPRAMVACPAGERHDMGAQLVATMLSLDGWHVRFLGADTPGRDIARMAASEPPVFVGLSVSMDEHVPEARSTIALVRQEAPGTRVMVGGHAALPLAQPWEPVRADALGRTAGEAIGLARAWSPSLGTPPPMHA
jgi:methanogenic corrinoid protein MtbC1